MSISNWGIEMENEEFWVVIIDDSNQVRMAIRRILTRSVNFRGTVCIEEAVDGIAGAELISSRSGKYPDLVICDYDMPGRNGLSLLEEFHKRTKFIVASGNPDNGLVEAVIRTRSSMLPKPFRLEVLVVVVETIINKDALIVRSGT